MCGRWGYNHRASLSARVRKLRRRGDLLRAAQSVEQQQQQLLEQNALKQINTSQTYSKMCEIVEIALVSVMTGGIVIWI